MTHGAILGGLIGLVLGGVVGIMLHFSIAVPIGLILGMACGGSFGANWGNRHKGKGPFVSWKPRHWMLAVAAFLLITHLGPSGVAHYSFAGHLRRRAQRTPRMVAMARPPVYWNPTGGVSALGARGGPHHHEPQKRQLGGRSRSGTGKVNGFATKIVFNCHKFPVLAPTAGPFEPVYPLLMVLERLSASFSLGIPGTEGTTPMP